MAPERYGKYNLLERIGVGGMAEVWRAKTLGAEGFTKDLVIKRILPKFTGDEESVRMFIDEARLVAKMHHPNIVQIFDFDKEGDRYYLAMELVEGRDLRLAEKAAAKSGVWFPIPVTIYMIAEALKGLHYAHTRLDHGKQLEIVHRDVSPHNILISFSGDVKISDFGIAKVAERASAPTTGTVKGKLAYMSPEQITGQPLDGRTDIYSMGIVFWELLTRHRLFFGPDEHDVVRRVRDGVVPPPRQYNPEIPEEVEKIVLKMLVPNRANRYQSAGEVARVLCALPQYAYEAQGLGEFMQTLFPEKTRNWTKVLQSMLSAPRLDTLPPATELPKKDKPAAAKPTAAAPVPAAPIPAPAPASEPERPVTTTGSALDVEIISEEPAPPSPQASLPARAAEAAPPAVAKSAQSTPPPPPAPRSDQRRVTTPPASPLTPPAAIPPAATSPSAGSSPPPAPLSAAARSNMAGSEQKTQIATELPPEVAAALGGNRTGAMSSAPAAVPYNPAPQGARTMIAEAPQLPSPPAAAGAASVVLPAGSAPPMLPPPAAPPFAGMATLMTPSGGPQLPPPQLPPSYGGGGQPVMSQNMAAAAGARTMIAEAPQLPPGPSQGLPHQQATMFAMPAPQLPSGPAGNPNMQQTLPPGSMRGMPGPMAMRPAGVAFPLAVANPGMSSTLRWLIGPAIAIALALTTTAIANRIWPPGPGQAPSRAPVFLAASRKVQIVIEPPGAEVQVDGEVIEKKSSTEAELKGEIGKVAKVRITLPGYDAYEATVPFTDKPRPPLRVKLAKAGSKAGKGVDPSVFDERIGVKDPDGDGDKKPPEKKPDDSDKVTDKTPEKTPEKTPDKTPDKVAKTDDKTDDDGKKGRRKKDKEVKKAVKPLLTVTVRPWAIVYLDGKKLQQTPLRDFPVSPGNHTLLLVNDSKGKRETIKLKVSADEPIKPINRVFE